MNPLHKIANSPVCLAPMVGLSNLPLRRLVRQYLPDEARTIWPTEMLNSRRLPSQKMGLTPETLRDNNEIDLVPQILGNEEEFIAASLKKLEAWGIMGVDINMGCPVKKALRHNYGVALMGDASYAAEVVKMTTRNTTLPVSVKLRAGRQGETKFLIQFSKGLVDAGASWITLHPRTPEQKRRGNADWNQIRLLKEELPIPVIGNGDIQTKEDVYRMLDETGCDMVMIGRALTVRPWLLAEVACETLSLRPSRPIPQSPEEEAYEYGRNMKWALEMYRELFKDQGLKKYSFLVRANHMWLNYGHSFFSKLQHLKGYEQASENLEIFFKRPGLKMMGKTELRY